MDEMLERILAYLSATIYMSLYFWIGYSDKLIVVALADADHGGCPDTARSTSGACTFLIGGAYSSNGRLVFEEAVLCCHEYWRGGVGRVLRVVAEAGVASCHHP
jgi:hypothetical protein